LPYPFLSDRSTSIIAALSLGLWHGSTARRTQVELKSEMLSLLRGGDQGATEMDKRCDMIDLTPIYVGCVSANSPCLQCGDFDPEGAFKPGMGKGIMGAPGSGSREWGTGTQSVGCGHRWLGYCVSDPSSPTGFSCVLTTQSFACVTSRDTRAQTFNGDDPPGSGN
jgi:hypothetical protein